MNQTQTEKPLNVELLNRVVSHIETHRDQHSQEDWGASKECGTTYCFAGWTLQLTGVPFVWTGKIGEYAFITAVDTDEYRRFGTNGVSEAASDLLGLNEDEAWDLFHTSTNFEEVRATVAEIIDGAYRDVNDNE